MLLRIRSKEGMSRIQVDPSDTFASLAQKIASTLKLDNPDTIAVGDQPQPDAATPIVQLKDKTIGSTDLKHGDIVYVSFPELTSTTDAAASPSSSSAPAQPQPRDASGYIPIDDLASVKQDNVDDFLEKQRGLIKRPKDSDFCRHGDNAMCDYCMPLEPYDQRYLEEHKIKHMSFHAYLRQIDQAKQTSAPSSAVLKQLPPLEEPNYKVKVPCTGGHAPWPEGICTKCQPSAITLQRQTYRMVDHIEFSSAGLVDTFLNSWRSTGCQRIGYLYGRYEPYLDVPLGIKAVVEAIYEPPQENHVDGIKLALPWDEEETMVNKVAEACGLSLVGMVFTDLIDDGTGKGTVIPKRHVDSYFLSSLECAFAAEMQKRHPSPCRHSATGKYGSKFLSCVISGDLEGNIDVKAYQVSETATALQEADIIEPSRKPSVMRVRDSVAHERYVPEVFYKFKNEYGVVVKQSAKPTFPVEYLLVNVTNGFPHEPDPLFVASPGFAVENRHAQDVGTLAKYLSSASNHEQLKKLLSDFHVLCFLATLNTLTPSEFSRVCEIATQRDVSGDILETMDGWKTLTVLLKEAEGNVRYNTPSTRSATTSGAATPATSEFTEISCRHCTFANPGGAVNCEMCGLPLGE
ncbi:NPL4 family-domain-containing protein [Zychaea mexicana]|uniref:NPL4 family-domain-containing protein n=1 Tax=Zychaea mexicana TaxID=64656 RepID=UPI0022FE2FA2|nr:NPL4 family-domain-containing protein [Zychaea mexicana]KAI9491155.1 NPL4 family-domain-containing protein [Zychaea mexicana]